MKKEEDKPLYELAMGTPRPELKAQHKVNFHEVGSSRTVRNRVMMLNECNGQCTLKILL